jgi:MerR family Zn(II)-responsive transcriptional regulator of zntA
MGAEYSSGDLARATGNTVRTIRFYEEEGLLEPTEVSDGGHRRYTDEDLERLNLIGDLRELGLSLCEIKDVLALRKGCSCVAEFAERLEKTLANHVEQARLRIERLERVQKEIERTMVLVHRHMADGTGKVLPCDHFCGEESTKLLKVLAPPDAPCALHAGVQAAPEPPPKPAAAPPDGSGWATVAAAGSGKH